MIETMPGWLTDIREIKDFEKLPENAKNYINKIEELTGVKTCIISVGAERKEAIIRENPFK